MKFLLQHQNYEEDNLQNEIVTLEYLIEYLSKNAYEEYRIYDINHFGLLRQLFCKACPDNTIEITDGFGEVIFKETRRFYF